MKKYNGIKDPNKSNKSRMSEDEAKALVDQFIAEETEEQEADRKEDDFDIDAFLNSLA